MSEDSDILDQIDPPKVKPRKESKVPLIVYTVMVMGYIASYFSEAVNGGLSFSYISFPYSGIFTLGVWVLVARKHKFWTSAFSTTLILSFLGIIEYTTFFVGITLGKFEINGLAILIYLFHITMNDVVWPWTKEKRIVTSTAEGRTAYFEDKFKDKTDGQLKAILNGKHSSAESKKAAKKLLDQRDGDS
ncbi:hypothetical protein [Sanyastnella coralliicola]|uniref:hypothetical protein n=1 Tax=Sanyastnella coralliicola TaxID=3069118 RepID=UPI0027BA3D46|nr:hypothetical protein [Longitalea sp. SCSIO 12813]